MTNFPDSLPRDETPIIEALLDAILSHTETLLVRLFDGEDWATEWTRSLDTLCHVIGATDETRVFIARRSDNGAVARLGSILLVHGNGGDVISGSYWNPRQPGAAELITALCDQANARGVR